MYNKYAIKYNKYGSKLDANGEIVCGLFTAKKARLNSLYPINL